MMNKEARLEMIKAAAAKVERRNKLKGKSSIGKLTRHASQELEARREKNRKIDAEIEKLNDNTHLYWNDSSQFAEKYYGETYRETTKFDNDWN
jgi:hypothetical protein